MRRNGVPNSVRAFVSLFIGGWSSLHAGIVADGSLGAAGPLAGPHFAIPASLGKQSGPNLFHSFSQFNIATGESATFSGPAGVQNVLARVTGGSASSIDGLLRSTIANANLFLINPSGVMFGPNASVDVGGAFVVTTGDHVDFTDGSRFNAAPGVDGVLTSAPPAAFGFLPAHSGVISTQGSQLTGAAGKTWALAGGDVQFKDTKMDTGGVVIRGGKLTMDNSKLSVTAVNPGDGVDVQMAASVELTNGGRLIANTSNADPGGNIRVEAHDILIRDLQSGIEASAADIGPGGNIQLVTRKLTIRAGGVVQSSTLGPGPGGNVRVDAATVSIVGGSSLQTGISADNLGGEGAAGTVRLNITGQLTIAGGALVSSDTFGTGAGGDVNIAARRMVADGRGVEANTGISTQTLGSGGAGGKILLNIRDTLQLIGGGQVSASTASPGPGGSIGVNAARVFISGKGALFFPGISASSENEISGPGGGVRLTLRGSLEIVDGGQIAVSTSGPGAGGSVQIAAQSVSLAGKGSGISAKTLAGLNSGRGGDISITTDSLEGSNGGEISASTAGSGAGGSIQITARRFALNNFRVSADTTSPDTIAIPVTVSQLNVTLDIDNSRDELLDLGLLAPDGVTFVDLFGGVGGAGMHFHNTVLADDAPDSIASGAAPFTGRFQPLNPLAAFDGKTFNGLWVLVLFDLDPNRSDVAAINSWSLSSGGVKISSPDLGPKLPNPDGASNNISFLTVNLPPADIVPIKPGRGGDVSIHAGTLSLLGGARISARTLGAGAGGSIHVKADTISISSADSKFPAVIDAESTSTGAGGPGGGIFVTAKELHITGASGIQTGISAASFGLGASGSVQLKLGTLDLDSHAFIGSSNIGSGDAGSVSIRADDGVALRGGSLITTSALKANAGVIAIESGATIELHERSSITASAGTSGGSINLTAPDRVYLTDSSITATAGSQLILTSAPGEAAETAGAGGNISIDPQFIILDKSLISANAAIGQGGNINLVSAFFLDSGSLITATGAQAGTVTIAAPELDLSAALAGLSSSLASAETQLRERCMVRLRGDFSSFVTLGSGGIAPEPDERQPGF